MNKSIEELDLFLETGCAGEIIRLSEWIDEYDNKDDKKGYFWTLCISFYNNMNCGTERSFKHKLRHIWKIIKTGTPWKDEVILDIEHAKNLRDKLNEMIEKAEKIAPKT